MNILLVTCTLVMVAAISVHGMTTVPAVATQAATNPPPVGTNPPPVGTNAPPVGTNAPPVGTNAPPAGTNAPPAPATAAPPSAVQLAQAAVQKVQKLVNKLKKLLDGKLGPLKRKLFRKRHGAAVRRLGKAKAALKALLSG